MVNYKELYLRFFGFIQSEYIPCECCNLHGIEVHHIDCKGMGGSKQKDYIENLIWVCRKCHEQYGDKKDKKIFLYLRHLNYIKRMKPKYDINYDVIPLPFRYDLENLVNGNMI